MHCREAAELIDRATLEGGRPEDDAAFRAHLAGCPACAAELERARRVVSALEDAAPAMPPQLDGRLAEGARREIAGRKAARHRWQLGSTAASLAAAAALLLAAGLFRAWRSDASAPAGGDGGWRFVQGDAGNCRQGEAVSGLMPDRVIWTRSIPGVPGEFKPLAAQGLVIVNAAPEKKTFRGGGQLLAFDAETGEVRWQRSFPAGDFTKSLGFPDRCIRGGRLYVTDGRRCLVLDAATGRDLAALEPPEGAAGWKYLAAAGERLYGASGDGRTVFSVDAASGRKTWHRRLEGAAFVPALADGRMLVGTDRGELLAFDAGDGRELWRSQGAAPAGRASIHAGSGRGVALGECGEIAVFSAADGRVLWRRKLDEPPGAGLAMSDEAIYLQGGNRALALADGFTLWYQDAGTAGGCGAPTLAGRDLLASPGPEQGRLAVMSQSGRVLGTVGRAGVGAGTADGAGPGGGCDGAIVGRGRIFAVQDGQLLAVRCR